MKRLYSSLGNLVDSILIIRGIIYIFLPNSLIGIDSIAPLLLEIYKRNKQCRIQLYCFKNETYLLIKENVVLYNIVKKVGKLDVVGRKTNSIYDLIIHRVSSITWFGRLILHSLVNAKFVHFGLLHFWPFRLLYLVNRRNTIFIQKEYNVKNTSEAIRRKVRNMKPDFKADYSFLKHPAAGVVVGLNPSWELLNHPVLKRRQKYVLGWPAKSKVWVDYIVSSADRIIESDLSKRGISLNSKIIAYFLGNLGPGEWFARDSDKTMRNLLYETLDVLLNVSSNCIIYVKPHYLTHMDALNDFCQFNDYGRVVISHLHPAILATRAKFFVANYPSGVFAHGRYFRVPTIEFTDYSDEVLAYTDNMSLWPEMVDYFINSDKDFFYLLARQLIMCPPIKPPKGEEWVDEHFFHLF